MKYPQLVSTKAVNEISDWLIKRLEDLDIEHPCVYSRLLLSLLHTPLKINAIDLLEDLKQPYHFLNKNNEELKRLAAVESLIEVSAEENKSNIINLVNELHLKLQNIENNLEESSMIGRTSNSAAPSPNSTPSSNSKFYKSLKKIKRHHGNENPTKNYYLAFPALNSSKKASAMTTCESSGGGDNQLCFNEGSKEAKNLNMLSWSNLIASSSPNKRDVQKASVHPNHQQSQNLESVIKAPQNQQRRKQKRYDKRECGNRRLQKANSASTDVQFTTKTYNATFSPKKMQKVKSNANSNVNNSSKAKHQRNLYDSSTKRVVSGNRNTNLSNFAQNAPKWDGNGALGPWDMDFKGQWEMDHDLIGEFIQQQQGNGFNNKRSAYYVGSKKKMVDDEDAMLMKCLPTKLIDESLIDESDPLGSVKKPCIYREDHSISSLQSKFDEKVKAIWSGGDDNDPMKPLTYKQQFSEDDGISLASLASSFASEKNSLGLFNFNEQQQQRSFIIEVNVPPFYNEMTSSYGGGKAFHADYDYNNNNNNANNNQAVTSLYGGRGAMSKSNSFAATASPLKQATSCDFNNPLRKFDFIKSGTNLQTSIWSDGNFSNETESLVLKREVGDQIEHDGVDEVDSTCKKLSSIGTELKQWQSSCAEDEEVSLINHSDQSAFKKFNKTQLSSTIIRANYHPLNMGHSERSKRVDSSSSRDSPIDNYLTSDKTHFSPIMLDGHTFTIDSNWDDIQWERSESGALMYKNKTYQLWKSQNNRSMVTSGIDLEAMEDDAYNDSDKFSIKFAVNENNKASQTEENSFATFNRNRCVGNRSYLEINEEYCRRKLYDEYLKGVNESFVVNNTNKWRCLNNGNEDSNDYSFFSVNRFKNNNVNNNCIVGNNENSSNNSSSSSICTITSTLDTAPIDPFESWRNLKVENNVNVIDHDQQHTCMHSLWEQCLICARNIDEDKFIEKPQPANRRLKDELQMDGDEIMNVIQNLYITSDFCDDDEKDEECDGFDVNHVMNIIAMDDSMDGIGPNIEDESKFYETAVDLNDKCHKKHDEMFLEDFDEITFAKMQQEMDHEKCVRFLKWVQNSLVQNNNATITQDTNNNECLEVHRPTKNRKRRHSTCQNFMENKRYYSQEEGFTYHLNLASGVTPTFLNDFTKNSFDVNNLLFDASKMLKINIEKVFLIADPCLEIEAFKEYNNNNSNNYCGANYYRNILQQQHALIKHLDLSRPLTR